MSKKPPAEVLQDALRGSAGQADGTAVVPPPGAPGYEEVAFTAAAPEAASIVPAPSMTTTRQDGLAPSVEVNPNMAYKTTEHSYSDPDANIPSLVSPGRCAPRPTNREASDSEYQYPYVGNTGRRRKGVAKFLSSIRGTQVKSRSLCERYGTHCSWILLVLSLIVALVSLIVGSTALGKTTCSCEEFLAPSRPVNCTSVVLSICIFQATCETPIVSAPNASSLSCSVSAASVGSNDSVSAILLNVPGGSSCQCSSSVAVAASRQCNLVALICS